MKMGHFMHFVLAVALLFVCVLPAQGKKQDFRVTQKKYKPANQKILKQSWSVTLKSGRPSRRYDPESSTPVLHDGVIYVGTQGQRFYAVNATNGKKIWQYKHDEPIAATAVLGGGRVYFTDLGGRVVALNVTDGTLAWSQEFDQEMLGRPAIVDGKLILVKGEQEVLALSQESGEIIWHQFIRTYIKDITVRGHADLVADNGRLYLGLADGNIYALGTANGAVLWNRHLAVPLTTFKDIDGALVLHDDSLFVSGYFGKLYRLNKSSGQIVWSVPVAAGVAPLVTDQAVMVSDHADGSLHGYDRENGHKLWSNELNGSVLSAPVLFAGKVFVASHDGLAFLLKADNGSQLQRLGIGDGSINLPLATDSALYVLTNNGKLISFAQW